MSILRDGMPKTEERVRLRLMLRGAVQGVGFRPFVYRLATDLKLFGWVMNSPQGVLIEVEGDKQGLDAFLLRLEKEKPPRASIQSLESSFLDPLGFSGFTIRESDGSGATTAVVLPDIATCPDCLRDIFDPPDRRYLYPFTNCTNCGPRFTIITALPYDRPNTTMARFAMCEACRREYEDPENRRFHAQPNACPACGPQLALWDQAGAVLAARHEALLSAAAAIRSGKIVALKGLGGFHLLVDARNQDAALRLRKRKHREEKPLAMMVPSVESAKAYCRVSDLEERLLRSPESPIVLLLRRESGGAPSAEAAERPEAIAPAVAPRNPCLGVMLPYTPLHHLLLRELNFPVVATSGNLSDEPICTEEQEALERLGGVADCFLVHDRAIARHVDDSVVRILLGRELILRRARGYAPLPIHLTRRLPPLLAVGAHLKNAVAASVGSEVFISQHIGDLETAQAFDAFRGVIASLEALYDLHPAALAADAHPDYLSTKFALGTGLPVIRVQHHHAHVLSCMAENALEGPCLGVAWDGTGYGLDGTVWGGEFLRPTATGIQRVAHLRTFRLPGGERAVKEPRRAAIGLLHELFGEALFAMEELAPVRAFSLRERRILQGMLAKQINAPLTSAVGRLFDAVAAILALHLGPQFEGQAAMELEWAGGGIETDDAYPVRLTEEESMLILDWEPLVWEVLADARDNVPMAWIAAKFHNALVEGILAVAGRIGEERVVLTGGCFQNRYLTEGTVRRLRAEGFRPYWHQRVPPNDGGIALGQVVAASRTVEEGRCV
jgi:hydrogenase maturation protein HypF